MNAAGKIIDRLWEDRDAWLDGSAQRAFVAITALLSAGLLFTAKGISDIAFGLLVIVAFWRFFVAGDGVGRMWWALVILASVVIPALSWTFTFLLYRDWAQPYPNLDLMARLLIFLPLAWALAGSSRNVLLFWGVAAGAVVLMPWTMGEGWHDWARGFSGDRVHFNLRNEQHTAMFLGVTLLGLMSFSARFLSNAGSLFSWQAVVYLIAVVLCIAGLAVTQTRAAWLAVLLSFPFFLYAIATRWRGQYHGHADAQQRGLTRVLSLGLVGALVMVLALIAVVSDGRDIAERMRGDSVAISQLLAGNGDSMTVTSAGVRITAWKASLEWIPRSPLVGWGSGGGRIVLENTDSVPREISQNFGHLHNSYLELLINYGLLGAMFFAGLLAWVVINSWRAWRRGWLEGDFMLFLGAFLMFFLVINFFESFLFYSTGALVHNLVLAGFVTHIWRQQRATCTQVPG
ncbi:O-antigen ligase family protein [Thioalkalivibrio thiocyanodenitrificans]|uniref:O-antigen ligase family protein n=1 Tax=Thioalkalivibrio thiocyanodenitrificans TaxID=243063 RepID=UPI00037D267D|nr:O-antigen ligase family protein [Thioalkalivibrio thiocyanodenitrificans]